METPAKFQRFGGEEQAQMMIGMMFGAIGGAAGAGLAIASGSKKGALMVQEHGLTDPTVLVAE